MNRLNLDGLVSILATFVVANSDATIIEPIKSTGGASMKLDIANSTEAPTNITSAPEFGSRFGLTNSQAEITDPRYYGQVGNTGLNNVRDYPNEAFNPTSGGRVPSGGWTPNAPVSNSWNARENQPSSRLPNGFGQLNAPGNNVYNTNNWSPADKIQNVGGPAQLPTGNWNNPGLSSPSGNNGGLLERQPSPVNPNLYSSQTIPNQNAWNGSPAAALPYNGVPINRGYPNQLNPELLGNQVAWGGISGRPVTPELNNNPAQNNWNTNPELLTNQGTYGVNFGRIVTPSLDNYPPWSPGQTSPSNNWSGIEIGNGYPAQNVNNFPNQVSPSFPTTNPNQGQWTGNNGGSNLYNYPNQNFNGNSGVNFPSNNWSGGSNPYNYPNQNVNGNSAVNFPSNGWSGNGAGVVGSNYPNQNVWSGSPDWSGGRSYPVNWGSNGQGVLPQSRLSGSPSASDVIYFPEPGNARGKKPSITLLPVLTVAES